jgi:hypothetical protein
VYFIARPEAVDRHHPERLEALGTGQCHAFREIAPGSILPIAAAKRPRHKSNRGRKGKG